MGCIIELDGTRFDFTQNKFKQKVLIQILLGYMFFDVSSLSKFLGVSVQLLKQVQEGHQFLHHCAAERLGKIFLLTFSSPGRV
jgi:hypothetical protein